MTRYDEERLAELLRELPPAPEAWVRAAQELPLARRRLDDIVARAVADAAFRQAALRDLEAALRREGYEIDPSLLGTLRERLTASGPPTGPGRR